MYIKIEIGHFGNLRILPLISNRRRTLSLHPTSGATRSLILPLLGMDHNNPQNLLAQMLHNIPGGRIAWTERYQADGQDIALAASLVLNPLGSHHSHG